MDSYTALQCVAIPVRPLSGSEFEDELYGELAQDKDEIRANEAAAAMLQYGTSTTEPKPGTVSGLWYP